MTHETIDYIQRLHDKGYRVTPQRLIVLDAVCAAAGHATYGDIYLHVKESDPTIDQSTIYRALDVLVDAGLVTVSEIGEAGKVYQIAGEARHHHLVCTSCGTVLTLDESLFTPLIETIQRDYGFTVRADHLALSGLCQQCQQQ